MSIHRLLRHARQLEKSPVIVISQRDYYGFSKLAIKLASKYAGQSENFQFGFSPFWFYFSGTELHGRYCVFDESHRDLHYRVQKAINEGNTYEL